MNDFEILAPVGGQEQLIAAVRSGADAVYLGAKGFNARRNAENFDDLAATVAYCHARGVKVNVTVNTLVADDELDDLLDVLRSVAESGTDAVIVQDLAVAWLLAENAPSLSRHASTQMTIHNAAGVRALKTLGYDRVVLARELTLEEIKSVIAAAGEIEIETFAHGALCMGASGACYLSAMIGGRSGNRGLCAQPCRLDFRCKNRDYALSLKDMSYIRHLDALRKAGVKAIKIEGRMKRPEYVAAAVTACREAIAGRTPDLATLEAVFSRSGFTDGFLTGKRDLSMFGVRRKEDIEASGKVLGQLAGLYRGELSRLPLSMTLTLKRGEPSKLTALCEGIQTEALGPCPQEALRLPLNAESARQSLGKTGGTPFLLTDFSAEIDEGLMLPVSALNALRRAALDELLARRMQPAPHAFWAKPLPSLPAHTPAEKPGLHIRAQRYEQLDFPFEAELVSLPIEEIETHPEAFPRFGARLAGELPALIFPSQEATLATRLQALREVGLCVAVAENIGAVQLAREAGLRVIGGHGLNILNSLSLERYRQLGLSAATVSFELSAARLAKLRGELPRGALAYGYLPLMRFRACPAQGAKGCGDCDGRPSLTDRLGKRFPMVCHRRQYSSLLNCVPLYVGDKSILGADFFTLYYTIETPESCRHIYELFQAHAAPDFERTNGLLFRELL